jgi:ribosomal protein S18 acetylase RimI-like enzyme
MGSMNNEAAAAGVFRLVRDDEIERIAEIAVKAWTPIYEARRNTLGDRLFQEVFGDWQRVKSDEVRNAARNRPGMVWVTEVGGRIAGFTTFWVDAERRVGHIGNNAVDPEFQGRGIGTRQHREVLRLLRERGLACALVLTGLDEAHAPARVTYEKVGFKPLWSSVTYYLEL